MSLLSGKEIKTALEESDPAKRLIVEPFFDSSIQLEQGAASIDLRLGCRFTVAKRRSISHFAAYADDVHPTQLVDEYYIPLGGKFLMHPDRFALATTLEWIRLPPVFGGFVLGRSTFGRRGLVIATATGVQPNYSGVLTLESTNLGEIALEVSPGQSICQLFLHRIGEWVPDQVDRSVFLGSLRPYLGAVRSDPVTDFLRGLGD